MTDMYRTCLVCGSDFRPNDTLEHLGRGRRVAYDPLRGRLWQVCRSCKRWSLLPMESRWEALEEIEKVVADQARLLSRTDNVALLRAGPLEVVRVGRAELREEAWWRYGREFRERREQHRKLTVAAAAGAAGLIAGSAATGGMSFVSAWLIWRHAPRVVTRGARWWRFGGTAWRARGHCIRCGRRLPRVKYRERERLLLTGDEHAPAVIVACDVCTGRADAGQRLSGHEGDRVLRKVLAYHHFAGSSERRVEGAVKLIELAGGTRRLPAKVLGTGATLGSLSETGQVALEIAVHERQERLLLSMEVAELEAHWRREEELASIIDSELTPGPPLDRLAGVVRGASRPTDGAPDERRPVDRSHGSRADQ